MPQNLHSDPEESTNPPPPYSTPPTTTTNEQRPNPQTSSVVSPPAHVDICNGLVAERYLHICMVPQFLHASPEELRHNHYSCQHTLSDIPHSGKSLSSESSSVLTSEPPPPFRFSDLVNNQQPVEPSDAPAMFKFQALGACPRSLSAQDTPRRDSSALADHPNHSQPIFSAQNRGPLEFSPGSSSAHELPSDLSSQRDSTGDAFFGNRHQPSTTSTGLVANSSRESATSNCSFKNFDASPWQSLHAGLLGTANRKSSSGGRLFGTSSQQSSNRGGLFGASSPQSSLFWDSGTLDPPSHIPSVATWRSLAAPPPPSSLCGHSSSSLFGGSQPQTGVSLNHFNGLLEGSNVLPGNRLFSSPATSNNVGSRRTTFNFGNPNGQRLEAPPKPSALAKHAALLTSKVYTIHVGPNHSSFSVHEPILLQSPILKALCTDKTDTSKIQDQDQNKPTSRPPVDLSNIDPTAFGTFLTYMYTGTCPGLPARYHESFNDYAIIYPLYILAHQLQTEDLRKEILDKLQACLYYSGQAVNPWLKDSVKLLKTVGEQDQGLRDVFRNTVKSVYRRRANARTGLNEDGLFGLLLEVVDEGGFIAKDLFQAAFAG